MKTPIRNRCRTPNPKIFVLSISIFYDFEIILVFWRFWWKMSVQKSACITWIAKKLKLIRLRTIWQWKIRLGLIMSSNRVVSEPRFGGQSSWLKSIVWAIRDLMKQSLVKHNNKKYLNCFSTANMTRFAAWHLVLLWSLIIAPLHYTFLLKEILLTKLQINESKRPVLLEF